jgi:parallel beta-helix repeat protein
MKPCNLFLKTVLPILGILIASTAFADTIYVKYNGSDSRTRNQARNQNTPYRTIQKGVDQAFAGDTVVVLNGHYNEYVTMKRSGRANAPIVLRAESKEGAVLNGSIEASDKSYITIDGFELANWKPDAPQTKGIVFYRCHNITIRNNRVHDCRGGGISCDQSDWLLIEWNIVYRNAFWDAAQHSGISVYQPQKRGTGDYWGVIIRNNTCFSNENKLNNVLFNRPTDGNGIVVDDFKNEDPGGNGVVYDRPSLITNNFCLYNGGQGIHCYQSNNVYIRNNTCFNNLSSFDFGGEVSVSKSTNCFVYNNILFARSGKNVSLQFDSTGIWWDYNLLHNGPVFGASNGPNTIYSNPLFTGDGSLRLRSDSPAVDVGVTHSELFPLDVDGRPRVINGRIDLGAKELQN